MSKSSTKEKTSQPTEGEYARLHRILHILQLIQGQNGWDVTALARECRVAPRTIYRDMELLEGAHIPYYFDEQAGGYRVRGDFFMKPIELTLAESLAIIALGEHLGGKTSQIPFMQAAGQAVAKIRSQLPDALRHELQNVDHHLAIRLGQTASDEAADVFARVQSALASHHCLDCEYESVGEKSFKGPFTLEPYSLFFSRRSWYVIGRHSGRRQVRCLKLCRFTKVIPTDQTFTMPKGFSLSRHLGNAWWMIRGKKTYQVALRFDADFATTIADTHWHKTQKLTWADDGSLLFQCRVDGLDEIVWWILSMGPHCKVLHPRELADQVRELAVRTATLYLK